MPLRCNPAQLFVFDVEKSCAHFERALGFSFIRWTGVPPHYAELRRDAAHITLRSLRTASDGRDEREHQELQALSIELDSLDELKAVYDHALKNGGRIRRPIEARAWGAWIFTLRDLDGNMLLLSAPIATAGQAL